MSDERTYRDAVAAHFRAHPYEWLDGLTLSQYGGAYAWRTRVSNCRTDLGMNIENRVRQNGRRKVSEYRYVPASLFESAQ